MGRVGLQPPNLRRFEWVCSSTLFHNLTKTLPQGYHPSPYFLIGQEVLIRGQFCAMKVLIAFKDLRFLDLLVDDGWDGWDG